MKQPGATADAQQQTAVHCQKLEAELQLWKVCLAIASMYKWSSNCCICFLQNIQHMHLSVSTGTADCMPGVSRECGGAQLVHTFTAVAASELLHLDYCTCSASMLML
jgi:hypothetical protein